MGHQDGWMMDGAGGSGWVIDGWEGCLKERKPIHLSNGFCHCPGKK